MSANVPSVIAKRAVCVPAPCRRHGLQFRDLMMILLAASLNDSASKALRPWPQRLLQ